MQKNNKRVRRLSFDDYISDVENNDKYDESRFNLRILAQIFSMMKSNKITNAELSKRMGVSRAYITKLFNGNCNFTIKTLINISKALDCEIHFKLNRKKVVQSTQSGYSDYPKDLKIACKSTNYKK